MPSQRATTTAKTSPVLDIQYDILEYDDVTVKCLIIYIARGQFNSSHPLIQNVCNYLSHFSIERVTYLLLRRHTF